MIVTLLIQAFALTLLWCRLGVVARGGRQSYYRVGENREPYVINYRPT
jgi:hypothetical protein